MTEAERDEIIQGEVADYAEAKVRAGFWPRDRSLAQAREEIAAIVGPDPAKRGHEFFFGVDGTAGRIGWVWYGPVPGSNASRGKRWLYQIVVDEPHRGRGLGRGLLAAVERRLAREGVGELSLNVFRWNSAAIALYASSGYEVVSQNERNQEMRKRVDSP